MALTIFRTLYPSDDAFIDFATTGINDDEATRFQAHACNTVTADLDSWNIPLSSDAFVQTCTQIAESAADAYELGSGTVNLGAPLIFASQYANRLVGMHFDGVEVPQGVFLDSAAMLYTPADDQSSPAQGTWCIVEAEDSAPFSQAAGSLSGLQCRGMRTQSFPDFGTWVTAERVMSGAPEPELQEVFEDPDWVQGNDLTLLVEPATPYILDRWAESFDSNRDAAPVLVVSYINNRAPVAVTDEYIEWPVGTVLQLDASASYDPEGDPFTYQWTLWQADPVGGATLDGETTATPNLVLHEIGTYKLYLELNDLYPRLKPTDVTVVAVNTPPVADAGDDQTVNVRDIVTLDGNESHDANGDDLTYAWAFDSRPDGSTAQLSDPSSRTPTFLADKFGLYTVLLIVNDGLEDSAPDPVDVNADNTPPEAEAGPAQSVPVLSTVYLDGSGSHDAENDPLTYQWSFESRPPGSNAVIEDATSEHASFVPYLVGDYIARLIVNDGTVDSAPDTVPIEATNLPPIADAGSDDVYNGNPVAYVFDGSNSSDTDGHSLTYMWTLESAPPGSEAVVLDAETETPSLVPDLRGDYTLHLIVSDRFAESIPDPVTLEAENIAPVAYVPHTELPVVAGSYMVLNGAGSSDEDGDDLTAQWTLVGKPAGSTAELQPTARPQEIQFIADTPGQFVLELVESDGQAESDPVTVTVEAQESEEGAWEAVTRDTFPEGIYVYTNDPVSACQVMQGIFEPDAGFAGAHATWNWASYHCDWEKWCYGEAGICGVENNSTSYKCFSGRSPNPIEDCSIDEEPEEPECREPGGSNISPHTPFPINVLSGSKRLHVTDFETADSLLAVRRSYNSRPSPQALAISREPLGLGKKWRFDFLPELQIKKSFSWNGSVTLHWPDGTPYNFKRASNGVDMEPVHEGYGDIPVHEFRIVEWPSNEADVEATQTTWKLLGPDGTLWEFESFDLFDAVAAGDHYGSRYGAARPVKRTTIDGYQWTYNYSATLDSIVDSFGRTLTFAWEELDRGNEQLEEYGIFIPVTYPVITEIGLPDGTSLSYNYEPYEPLAHEWHSFKKLTGVDTLNAAEEVISSETYHYDARFRGNLTGVTDARGVRTLTVAYDDGGRAVSSERAGGVDRHSVEYGPNDTSPKVRTVTNALGKQTQYSYNSPAQPYVTGSQGLASENVPASSRAYTYDNGFIESVTDEEGRVTQYIRDERGRPLQTIEAVGTPEERIINTTWHETFDKPTVLARPGLTTTYTYNSDGRLEQVTEADTTTHTEPYSTNGQTRTTTYTYTPEGLLDTVDGPLPGPGDTIYYDYDNGYLSQVTNALGHATVVVSVNGRGQPTEVLYPNGVAMAVSYDDLGRPISKTYDLGPDQAVTTLEYDEVGNITESTRPDGSHRAYAYDDAGRTTTVTNNLGDKTEYSYDGTRDVTQIDVKSASGLIVKTHGIVYDELSRVLRIIGGGLQETSYGYDSLGNLTSRTDSRGNSSSYTFDARNRLSCITGPNLAETQYAYYDGEDVAAVIDAENHTTTYVRNGFGDLIRTTSPDSGTIDYVVNELGRVVTKTDARGVTSHYSYDNAGRLLSTTFVGDPTQEMNYQYDNTASNDYGIGRITGFTDASGSTMFAYDAHGNVTRADHTVDEVLYSVQYGYDSAARLVEMIYPSGRVVTYERGANGQIVRMATRDDAAPELTVADTISYAPFSQSAVQSLSFGNGLDLSHAHDLDGRIVEMQIADGATTVVQDLTLTLDPAGHIETITDNEDPGRNQSFEYDSDNRLETASGAYGLITYSYDLVGNRTSRTVEDGVTVAESYLYEGGGNRLDSVTTPAYVRDFSYTAAGSVEADTRQGRSRYLSYNSEGQLATFISTTNGDTITGSYVYDATRRRVAKTIDGLTTHFVYDTRTGRLIAEGASDGTVTREYLWLNDTPVAIVDYNGGTSELFFIHTDHLLRPQTMTDSTMTVVWDAEFLPFGEAESIAGLLDLRLRFPGQYYDDETGFHYNTNRYYDPETGRYTSADPIGLDGDINPYAYVQGNPMNTVDPLGLFGWTDVARALTYYCAGYGTRASWTTSFESIDWGDIETRISDAIDRRTGGFCFDAPLAFNEVVASQTAGADANIVGQHNLRVTGTIDLSCDCTWTFSGVMSSDQGYDRYNMNQAQRARAAETKTAIGRNICPVFSKPFKIYIVGRKSLALNGVTSGRPTCCEP